MRGEHVLFCYTFHAVIILTKRTNKIIFQGNCLLLKKKKNMPCQQIWIHKWWCFVPIWAWYERNFTSALRSRLMQCRWQRTWGCREKRKVVGFYWERRRKKVILISEYHLLRRHIQAWMGLDVKPHRCAVETSNIQHILIMFWTNVLKKNNKHKNRTLRRNYQNEKRATMPTVTSSWTMRMA